MTSTTTANYENKGRLGRKVMQGGPRRYAYRLALLGKFRWFTGRYAYRLLKLLAELDGEYWMLDPKVSLDAKALRFPGMSREIRMSLTPDHDNAASRNLDSRMR